MEENKEVISKTFSDPSPLNVTIRTPNIIKPNQGQTDNSVITSTLKTHKYLDIPKITQSNTSISHRTIPDGQITLDQQNTNPTTYFTKSSFPLSLSTSIKNPKEIDEHSATYKSVTAL